MLHSLTGRNIKDSVLGWIFLWGGGHTASVDGAKISTMHHNVYINRTERARKGDVLKQHKLCSP